MTTSKKTHKKTAKKVPPPPVPHKAPRVEGGDAPAAALAVPPPSPRPSLDMAGKMAALDALANRYNEPGHMVLVRGNEAPNPYILRRPTGIMELDVHLAGGFPAGGTCFVSGPDNSGKTWLMMQTMAMQQKIYGSNCLMAMAITEGGFPYDQAIRVGLHIEVPDEMILQWQQWRVQRGLGPYQAADIARFKKTVGDFRIIRGLTGEETLGVVLDVVKTNACSVICLDSIQDLQPSADAEKEMDDNDKMMAHATLMGKFFKKYIPYTTGISGMNQTTLLMTQQVRANKAKAEAASNIQKYLKDYAITGSYAARHFKLVDLVLEDGSVQKKDMPGYGKVAVGKTLKWYFEKGKAGCHDNVNGEVQYSYEIAAGVDFVGTIMDAAMQRGVLRKCGNLYSLVRPETGEMMPEFSAPSLKAFRKYIELDAEFELGVRMEVLAAAGVQCLYQ